MVDVLRKDQLEKSLFDERQLIKSGEIQEDNPLDLSPAFRRLCEASRRGDLKVCQEAIQEGANLNASDEFNYTPLILASLCGHYDVVQLLLESGALCERDTFQGERCLYNALTDNIRNLLLQYDYSKSTDPLQPYAAHVSSLLSRKSPETADFLIKTGANHSIPVHRFILAARSPYFKRKLGESSSSKSWVLPEKIPLPSLIITLRYLYLGELPRDVGDQDGEHTDEQILEGVDRLARLFETQNLMQRIVQASDRRVQRQQRQAEIERGRTQIDSWFADHVLKHRMEIESNKVNEVKWSRDNSMFADVLLATDEEASEELTPPPSGQATPVQENTSSIPIGPASTLQAGAPVAMARSKSTIFPVHKAMLLRSEYFSNMFSSTFLEAQDSEFLRVIPVACSPQVLESILKFLYGERTDFSLQVAIDVLFAADMLLIERLKAKAAVVISSLGNGAMTTEHPAATPQTDPFLPNGAGHELSDEHGQSEEDPLDPYATLRAAWDLRVPRLETFAARYFAYRLEKYIDEEEFAKIVGESAQRIEARQETDTIELIDDIRHFLNIRFNMRFEGEGIEAMLNGETNDPDADEAGRTSGVQDLDNGSIWEDAVKEKMKEMTLERNAMGSKTGAAKVTRVEAEASLLSEKQVIRTLDGEVVDEIFAADAQNYQILMGKIDKLLDNLQLDA